jgi:dTDP-glucose pyrophosphorylase
MINQMSVQDIVSSHRYAWKQAIISFDANIQQAITALNQAGVKLLMILDEKGKLKGTVSDGDIRRGLLKGVGLASPVAEVLHCDALVVPPGVPRDVVMKLMVANKIQQIPVVDEELRVIGLHVWDEITTPTLRSNRMVIMAGGKGTRLRPFTENCPKPLVMVAGKPMLEHIIERARLEGFTDFVIAIHHLGHMIEEHFKDGSDFDVNIEYLRETKPLGTAGALSMLYPDPEAPFVVTNGDVVTDIRYGDLLDFHVRHDASATMAVLTHEWQHPYGVVQTSGVDIVGFEEKPIARTHINAGVYALSPSALSELSEGEHCDMPTLFERLQARSLRTVAYPMHEPWLDVGRPDDLEKAHRKMTVAKEGKQ